MSGSVNNIVIPPDKTKISVRILKSQISGLVIAVLKFGEICIMLTKIIGKARLPTSFESKSPDLPHRTLFPLLVQDNG